MTSKALVFVAIALSQYVVAETARRWHDGDRGLRQLARRLASWPCPPSACWPCRRWRPSRPCELVFGPDLAGGAPQLTTLVAATTCLGAAVLLAHYLLAAGRREVVGALVVAAVVVAGALSLADGRPGATADTLLACHAGLAAGAGRAGRAGVPAPPGGLLVGDVLLADRPRRVDAHEQLAGDGVAPAEGLGPVLAHVAAPEPRGPRPGPRRGPR